MLLRTLVRPLVAVALCATPLSAGGSRPVLHDAVVVTDDELVRGADGTVFVAVSGATSLTESAPIAGAEIELSLAAPEDAPRAGAAKAARPPDRPLARGRTGADGTAVLRFRVPAVEPGPYRLIAVTRSRHGANRTERAVAVSDRMHLQLGTDRGVYRPGQTILWRVTALSAVDAHPAAGEEVEIAVRDPRDTAIWRGRQTVPPSGMIAGSIPLADDLLTGRYELSARVRDIVQTERVEVRVFRLPAFAIELQRRGDRRLEPGGELPARLSARYRYGEPVQGDVTVELFATNARGERVEIDPAGGNAGADAGGKQGAPGLGGPLRGRLDGSGAYAFTARVPADAEGAVELRAVVTDGAGRRERAVLPVVLGGDEDLRVALVPERQSLTRGAMHWFTALTTDGRGALVPARVQIRAGGRPVAIDSSGARRVALRAPDAATWKLRISAVGAGGDVDEQTLAITLGDGPTVRLREAVVAAGDPVVVTGEWRGARGPILATLLRGHTPIASALARVDRRGQLRAVLTPPTGSFGLVAVRLVELGWEPKRDRSPADAAEHLNAYLRPAELSVSIAAETRHRPGQRAELEVAVRDAAGRPVPGAALAASAVDERVLALSEPRPDLTEALRSVDDVEDATTLGLAFADLLRATSAGRDAPASARAAAARDAAALRAILEALRPPRRRPEVILPAQERWQHESARIARMSGPALERLVAAPGAIGRRGADGRWRYGRELWQVLAQAGWKAADRITPWREPTTWDYAVAVDPELGFARMAPRVAEARLDDLVRALGRRRSAHRRLLLRRGSAALGELAARGAIGRSLAVDPWGTAIRVERHGGRFHPLLPHPTVDLVSAGPDLAFGTADDLRREDVFSLIGVGGVGTIGYGSGSGTAYGGARGAMTPSVRIGAGDEEPLVRRRFDETVLWRVGIATGPTGAARLHVPLGDSITGWKVAVEALSRTGATGSAEARLETFLPLHLDAELPPRLAVGDRYRIPIAVANHSGRARRLRVAAELGGALRRSTAARTLELAAGATGVVHVDAEAQRAGSGRVRVALLDGARAVDQVERAIAIEPPGELVRALHTGDVVDGAGRFRFDLPAAAASGSTRGMLRLFRGAADQALDGLDGMLAEPHGCFEQTSSTTYPNLLVLRLLRGTPRMASVRARARDLVGRGYQRLISYEVKGGGFSWFGEEPANQVLTAYGLMEFVDMAAVYPVDPALIARTRTWLVGKQQRDGSWRPDRAWLHDWSAVQSSLATTAFIAWALAESGATGRPLDRALAYLRGRRTELARSPYLLALWAAAESAHDGRRNRALPLLLRAGAPGGAGLAFRAGGATLLHARGPSADVQVTALAATALARGGRGVEARRALDWLWQARSGTYGWGTTQSTVLALRAAALASAPAPTSGILHARIDGRPAGTIDLASVNIPSLTLPALPPGPHELTLEGAASGQLRADLRLSWRERRAPQALAAGLSVALDAPASAIPLGGRASFTAKLRNLTREPIAMPTAVLPIPPGFAADPSSVARLRRTTGISRVEDQGDALVVYLLDLAPGASIDLLYHLDAEAECHVLQRPATAYAFYTPELRGRSSAHRLTIRRGAPTPRTATTSDHHRSPPRAVWW